MLQTLTKTVQGLTEAGNQWQQGTAPSTPATTTTPLDSLTAIPKIVRLEFPRFKGENPSKGLSESHSDDHLQEVESDVSSGLVQGMVEDMAGFKDCGIEGTTELRGSVAEITLYALLGSPSLGVDGGEGRLLERTVFVEEIEGTRDSTRGGRTAVAEACV
nr:hypothetical protein CFP56_69217 [Quercus suber]